MILFDPAHPGELIRETLEGLREETGQKLTISEVAESLGTTRKTPEMAIRLGIGLPNTSAEFWVRVQENFDLSQAVKKVDVSNIKPIWKPIITSFLPA
jgi:plasmid maintenance system antidote protein VapI